jgi:C4-dicarboxylate-binding protein DctP
MSAKRTVFAIAAGLLLVMASMADAQAAKILKYAHFQPAKMDQPMHAAAVAFKNYVEAASGGSIEVQIFPASQFGSDSATMEALRLGTLEMAVAHDGAIAGTFKPIIALGIPFLFNDEQEAWTVLDGPFGKEFGKEMLAKTGIHFFGFADNGLRHFTNSKHPIVTPDDLKGLKIRVMPSPVFEILIKSLGASPSSIPWTQLPTALQEGIVDGEENSVTNIIAASLYQSQKYVTLDAHVYSVHAYLINDKFYQSLTDREKGIVHTGIEIARVIHRGMTTSQDLNAKDILSDLGMTVTTLTPQQVEAFRVKALPPVREYVEKETDKSLVDLLFSSIDAYRHGAPAE